MLNQLFISTVTRDYYGSKLECRAQGSNLIEPIVKEITVQVHCKYIFTLHQCEGEKTLPKLSSCTKKMNSKLKIHLHVFVYPSVVSGFITSLGNIVIGLGTKSMLCTLHNLR